MPHPSSATPLISHTHYKTAPQSPSAPSSKPHPQEVEDVQHQKQKRLHDQDKEEERTRQQEGPRPDKRRPSRDKMAKEEAEAEQLDYIEEEAVAPPPPAKEAKATMLLDELFRKTKATPCIYWLPLTDAQVRVVSGNTQTQSLYYSGCIHVQCTYIACMCMYMYMHM